jgi:DNA-binding NtrC family response regulator
MWEETERQLDSALSAGRGARVTACLRVFTDPAGTAHAIEPAGVTLGRRATAAEADILLDDGLTSRRHARIALDGGGWRLHDLGSRNGGFVDGAAFAGGSNVGLRDGAVIRLGDTLAVFSTAPLAPPDGDGAFFPGVSAAAHEARQRTRALAAATGHVLVLGETGTGKERVARRLGQARAFVPLNCAELSRDMFRSELFGHVKGSFTGATAARAGLVETAGDGVLFLDEVGEIPLDVQGELLRFLEDGSYRPLGSSELRTSRTRIVAATNVDLDDAVAAGSFRRDLLARLRASNKPLELVPLRQRRDDIPGWADAFLREAVSDPPAPVWTAGLLECLLLYDWPDNLRELRSAIRGALEEPRAWPLHSSRLPARIRDHRAALREPTTEPPAPAPDADGPPIEPPTHEQITAALVHTRGVMLTAAKLLGIDRRALYRHCKKLGIDPDPYRQDP